MTLPLWTWENRHHVRQMSRLASKARLGNLCAYGPNRSSTDEYARLVNSVRVSFLPSAYTIFLASQHSSWYLHRISGCTAPVKIVTHMYGEQSRTTRRARLRDEPIIIQYSPSVIGRIVTTVRRNAFQRELISRGLSGSAERWARV